jgi:O-antigen chain-terminating methyltransferase
MQRLLFWYTPQIHGFHDIVAQALDSAYKVTDGHYAALQRACERIANLEQQNLALRASLNATGAMHTSPALDAAKSPGGQPETFVSEIPERFIFLLQNRFRGSEEETMAKLAPYVRFLRESHPNLCGQPSLDVGCGRGEWLRAARAEGLDTLGIDESQAAVSYCRALDLTVERDEALSFLRRAASHSYAVITAFHVIEHWRFDHLLRVLEEVRRVLRPGGILILETPNPENLNMASHAFWLDPTHVRPVPPQLLREAVLSSGLTPLAVEGRNPPPESELGPYARLPFLAALNRRLAAPQDYCLIAIREP